MSTSVEPESNTTVHRAGAPSDKMVDHPTPDVTHEIQAFNDKSKEHEDLWSRARHAADQVRQAEVDARDADRLSANAELGHKALLAEYPDRTAPRLRQWLIATGILALDGVACYFAAETLNGSPVETLAWAGLFLAVLGAGEVALDLWRDAHSVLWRWTAFLLGAFIALLCVLRFWFLATIGTGGLASAAAGAGLFSLLTAGFVILGYKALRAAETREAWAARRRARDRARSATAAWRRCHWLKAKRNRLAHAYLSRFRTRLISVYDVDQLPAVEQSVFAHLIGEDGS